MLNGVPDFSNVTFRYDGKFESGISWKQSYMDAAEMTCSVSILLCRSRLTRKNI
jgi:hypothetical protein